MNNQPIETEKARERAIAVSVAKKGGLREKSLEHLDELEFLAETAGAVVVEKIYQELEKPNPKFVVGKGKLEEIKETIAEEDVSLIIFDDDISPAQARNLENSLKIKILDRSGLILDIFASRAKTNEAKTQVELAQHEYLLPRLSGMWTHLSKQYGGVGMRGPGETQIETDRRMIRDRIKKLKEKLADVETQREQQRKGRESFTRFALVGYTNAGKSTLMNALTGSEVYVEDKLFATLDATTRSFDLPSGVEVLLSDTVGFIRKLPPHLVASFRSTLAEAAEADALLHVVDVSHQSFRDRIESVDNTLKFLKINNKPTLLVFNKVDLLEERDELTIIRSDFPDCIFISAKNGLNISGLLEKMESTLEDSVVTVDFLLPYSAAAKEGELYEIAESVSREDKDEGTRFVAKIKNKNYDIFCHRFNKFANVKKE